MKVLAIDDEPIALSIISQYCERRGGITLETYNAPNIGMRRVREWLPNVVLLDIEMNGTSGIELARQLPPSCCLIFTTAYAHYALDGFDVEAVDFLHKPYFYERFDRAMRKAEQWLRMNELLQVSEAADRKIIVKSEYRNVTLPVGSILFVESIDNYVKIHLADGTSVISKIPLRSLEEQLPRGEFIRIHRSYVVARNRIASYTHSEITLAKSGKTFPIGKKYMGDVMSLLGQN